MPLVSIMFGVSPVPIPLFSGAVSLIFRAGAFIFRGASLYFPEWSLYFPRRLLYFPGRQSEIPKKRQGQRQIQRQSQSGPHLHLLWGLRLHRNLHHHNHHHPHHHRHHLNRPPFEQANASKPQQPPIRNNKKHVFVFSHVDLEPPRPSTFAASYTCEQRHAGVCAASPVHEPFLVPSQNKPPESQCKKGRRLCGDNALVLSGGHTRALAKDGYAVDPSTGRVPKPLCGPRKIIGAQPVATDVPGVSIVPAPKPLPKTTRLSQVLFYVPDLEHVF